MDTPPFTCPYCETVLDLPEDAWYYTCPRCQKRLDLKSQFAYLRGLDAFSEGQEMMVKIPPRRRRPLDPRTEEAMQLFREAYSSLQVAFQSILAEEQRALAVEMMSSMSREFMKWNLVSAVEMNYWHFLMVEQTAQKEYERNKQKLADLDGGLNLLAQMRWRIRQKQLRKALLDTGKKVVMLERQIEFIDIPRARRENWKP